MLSHSELPNAEPVGVQALAAASGADVGGAGDRARRGRTVALLGVEVRVAPSGGDGLDHLVVEERLVRSWAWT